ncbi:CRAL/TRIO domain-containing protein [Thozetella sp. PMI_491]|nr:CRAL/TRIO domain-containing protein [Thozetella sp. PMI_491]
MGETDTKPAAAAPAEEVKAPDATKPEAETEAIAAVPEAPAAPEAAPAPAVTEAAAPAEETKAEETKAEEPAAAAPKAEEVATEVPKAEEAKAAEEPKPEAPKEEVKEKPKKEVKLEAPPPKPTPMSKLWDAAKAHGHPEVWGVTLEDPEDHIPTRIVLQKYLNANDGDFTLAHEQLIKTLDWRRETKPLELIKKSYNKTKFEALGYVTSYTAEGAAAGDPEIKETFTWNVYGNTKSIDETFGDLSEFLEWRTALMELALQDLSIATATKPITAENDPYKIYQVHDYKNVSFLRQSASVKAASKETIRVFAQNYPELLKEKFFVNVPAIMGFIYTFVKLIVAPKTAKKFHPMANGGDLAKEFGASKIKDLAEKLPSEYGGKGGELQTQGTGPQLE